jgi:hypothetical protein
LWAARILRAKLGRIGRGIPSLEGDGRGRESDGGSEGVREQGRECQEGWAVARGEGHLGCCAQGGGS